MQCCASPAEFRGIRGRGQLKDLSDNCTPRPLQFTRQRNTAAPVLIGYIPMPGFVLPRAAGDTVKDDRNATAAAAMICGRKTFYRASISLPGPVASTTASAGGNSHPVKAW